MRGGPIWKTSILKVLGVAWLFAPVLLPAQLTPAQAAGKQIYTQGTSPSGRTLEAILGEGSTRVPATLMVCANCHGTDGKGKPEGGVVPSEITWAKLISASRSADSLARRRPAYNIITLRRAIASGIDSAGHELGATMPRYRMPPQELTNLIEYLKILGREPVPGLTESSIRVGTIVPASGVLAASGQSSVALLRAYFDEMNRQGGVYGRQLELVVLEVSGTPVEVVRKADEFIRKENVFGIVGVMAPGAELELAELMERLNVPAIVTFASNSESHAASRTKSFYLLSGLSQQAQVLVKFASEHLQDRAARLALVYPENMEKTATLMVEQCRAFGLANLTQLKYSEFVPSAVAQTLAQQNAGTVFFLGRGRELEDMLVAAAKLNWMPTVFQPGPLAGPDLPAIPAAFNERVFFSFPTLPSDLNPNAIAEYRTLAAKNKLASGQSASVLPLLASAKVLVEGLKTSGRQLDRDKFISTLSSMYAFNTGLTPPLTYGATRRIGALGAYVVKLDLKNKTLAPVDSWIVP